MQNAQTWISLVALDVGDDVIANGTGIASSSCPLPSYAEKASCSIFYDEDEDQYGMY